MIAARSADRPAEHCAHASGGAIYRARLQEVTRAQRFRRRPYYLSQPFRTLVAELRRHRRCSQAIVPVPRAQHSTMLVVAWVVALHVDSCSQRHGPERSDPWSPPQKCSRQQANRPERPGSGNRNGARASRSRDGFAAGRRTTRRRRLTNTGRPACRHAGRASARADAAPAHRERSGSCRP